MFYFNSSRLESQFNPMQELIYFSLYWSCCLLTLLYTIWVPCKGHVFSISFQGSNKINSNNNTKKYFYIFQNNNNKKYSLLPSVATQNSPFEIFSRSSVLQYKQKVNVFPKEDGCIPGISLYFEKKVCSLSLSLFFLLLHDGPLCLLELST